jgi:Uncharacterized protein, possibly involved in utilization of glycolate and propanediol
MNKIEIEKIVQAVVSEHTTRTMTLSLAKILIECIEERARELGLHVVIAVGDSSGNIVAVHSMDNAYIASYDIAVKKVFTSASLKMSTAALGEMSQPGQSLYGIQHTNDGKIVIFGGGEALEVDHKVIGALGVSGGSAKQDTQLAAFGKEVFKEVMKCL